jgi:hypothetical protein
MKKPQEINIVEFISLEGGGLEETFNYISKYDMYISACIYIFGVFSIHGAIFH